jgi:hypothetical protein
MKALILSVTATLLATQAMALDCGPFAGKWSLREESGQLNTVVISKNCDAKVVAEASRHRDESLALDFIFKTGEQWRVQYRVKPGTKDMNGNVIPYPMSAEQTRTMQGNLIQNDDGSIGFGMDAFDAWCAKLGTVCPSGKFFRDQN